MDEINLLRRENALLKSCNTKFLKKIAGLKSELSGLAKDATKLKTMFSMANEELKMEFVKVLNIMMATEKARIASLEAELTEERTKRIQLHNAIHELKGSKS